MQRMARVRAEAMNANDTLTVVVCVLSFLVGFMFGCKAKP
jgi:hypothetical protein